MVNGVLVWSLKVPHEGLKVLWVLVNGLWVVVWGPRMVILVKN